MTAIFNDINAALQHVVMHAELFSVKRVAKTCAFQDYDDYHILVALLTETGVTPEAKLFFENFALKKGKQDYVVRNYLYATGTFHSQTGIQVGDLFLARKSDTDTKTINGLVLNINEQGHISRYLYFESKNYDKCLVVGLDTIQKEWILEAFTLKIPIEPLPSNSPYLKFYGKFYEEILRRRGESILGYDYTLGSTKRELLIFNKDGFFKYLSLGAPLRITKLFLLLGSNIAEGLKICATLGKGLQVFTPATHLQAGTLLFTKEMGISLLIGSNTPDKVMPALVPTGKVSAYAIDWIKPSMISYFWEPSIEPFEYIKTTTNPAFKNINQLLGNLYCLSATYFNLASSMTAIFGKSLVLEPEIWHPSIYSILKGIDPNNDAEFWMKYLAKNGNGLLDEKTIPQVGDFLFVEIDKRLCSAIALPGGQMILASYAHQTIPIVQITGIKKIWRPSLTSAKS